MGSFPKNLTDALDKLDRVFLFLDIKDFLSPKEEPISMIRPPKIVGNLIGGGTVYGDLRIRGNSIYPK